MISLFICTSLLALLATTVCVSSASVTLLRALGTHAEVCEDCTSPDNLAPSLHALSTRYHLSTSRLLSIQRTCASCASTAISEHVKCESVDCPVLYARVKANHEVHDTEGLVGVIGRLDREERKKWKGEEIGVEVISLLDSDDD